MQPIVDVSRSASAPMLDAKSAPSAGGIARVILLGAVLLAAVLVVHLTPVSAALADAQRFRAALAELGIWVYPVSIAAIALLIGCGMPRLLLCAAGSVAFGLWPGLVVTQFGSLLGNYLAFLFIRHNGRDWVLQRWPRLRKWADMIHDHGIVGVFLVRQLPGHAMLLNACLALSHVKHVDFLIGTLLGSLPEAVPAALVGAGLVKASLMDSTGYLALAGAVVALIWIACGYALRSMRQRVSISELENSNG
jgi:uncharacterized membrane protein YdjX (TVP38/TMEM64 family)